MTVVIQTIPHGQQKYDTVGDWRFDADGNLKIFVSDLGSDYYNFLVGVHELWEAILCKARSIPTEDVDAFDIKFEIDRQPGNLDEPGDDPRAPYHREHCSATGVERLLCSELDIIWKLYEEKINSL